jgi:hypothetical protein
MYFDTSAAWLQFSTAPSGGGWGTPNEETLSADKTLTASDVILQILNPGSTTRTVTMPTAADGVVFFRIINNAVGVIAHLYIVDDNGFVITILAPGESDDIWHDGTFYYSRKVGKSLGRTLIPYGANQNATGQAYRAGGQGEDADGGTAEDGVTVAYGMPYRGIIQSAAHSFSASAPGQMKIWKNGVRHGNLAGGGGDEQTIYDRALNPVVFEQEDELAFANHTSTSITNFQALIKAVGGTTQFGAAFPFGASLTTQNNLARANGISGSTQVASTGALTQHPMPIAGNLVGIAWNVTTSGGSVTVQVRRNGSTSAGTVTLDDDQGFTALSQSFSAGDTYDIIQTSVTGPGASVFLLITDIPGLVYHLGGNHSSAAVRFLDIHGEADEAIVASQAAVSEFIVQEPGLFRGWAYVQDTGGNNAGISINRPGSFTNFAMAGTSGSTVGTATVRNVSRGDVVAFRVSDILASGNMIVNVYIGPT